MENTRELLTFKLTLELIYSSVASLDKKTTLSDHVVGAEERGAATERDGVGRGKVSRLLAETAEVLRELVEARDPLRIDRLVLDQFVKSRGDDDQRDLAAARREHAALH